MPPPACDPIAPIKAHGQGPYFLQQEYPSLYRLMRKWRAKSVNLRERLIIGGGSTRLLRMQDAKRPLGLFNRHFPSIEPQATIITQTNPAIHAK